MNLEKLGIKQDRSNVAAFTFNLSYKIYKTWKVS